MKKEKLKIGFSACFSHPDSERAIHKGKTLLYLEESIAHWLMSQRALPFLIPSVAGAISVTDLVDEFDALILQGGADVSPTSYREEPMRPEWSGDSKRDRYEITLFKEMLKHGKPILGICRGVQLLNVALGGTLFQDIATQHQTSVTHRCAKAYDQLYHNIYLEPGGLMEKIYGKSPQKVNSVHHQAIKDLAPGLAVEARSADDHLIEAVRYISDDIFVFGVQWHPEYQDPKDKSLLDPAPLLAHFLEQAERRKRA